MKKLIIIIPCLGDEITNKSTIQFSLGNEIETLEVPYSYSYEYDEIIMNMYETDGFITLGDKEIISMDLYDIITLDEFITDFTEKFNKF